MAWLLVPVFSFSPPEAAAWEARLQAARDAFDKGDQVKFRSEIAAAAEVARSKSDQAISLGDALMTWGSALHALRLDDEAELLFTRTRELWSYAYGPRDWRVAEPIESLSAIALERQGFAEAEGLLFEALSIRLESLGDFHVDVIATYRAIGSLYLAQDKLLKATEAMSQAMARRAAMIGADSVEFAEELDEVASVYEYHEQFEKADPLREKSRALQAAAWGEDDPRYILAVSDYASQQQSRHEVAERFFQNALKLASEHHGEESAVAARVFSLFADFRESQSKDGEAAFFLVKAIKGRIQALSVSGLSADEALELNEALIDDFERLALLDTRRGQHAQAARAYDQILVGLLRLERQQGRVEQIMERAATAYRNAGNYDLALERLISLLEFRKQKNGVNAPGVADVLEQLGDTYWLKKDYQAATQHYERMITVLEAQDPPPPNFSQKLFKLSNVYQQQGRTDDSKRVSWRALGVILATLNFTSQFGPAAWSLAFLVAALAGGMVVALIWGGAAVSEKMLLSAKPAPAHGPIERVLAPSREDPLTLGESLQGPRRADSYPTASEEILTASSEESFPAASGDPSPPPPAFPIDMVASGSETGGLGDPREPEPAPRPLPAPEFRRHSFHFQGDGGALFGIWVLNLLLTLVSFGIYYFWGKAKVRKYLYNNAGFDDDAFQFHGTGKELLIGWLKALPFLLLFAYGPLALAFVWKSIYAQLVGSLAVMALLTVVWPLAVVGAFRYRLSRSSWRRIRFSFRGRKRKYVMIAIGSLLLSILTLGMASPFRGVWLRSHLFNRAWFGNTPFRFTGKGGDLFGPFVIALLLTIPTLGLYWLWYWALRENYYWSRTSVAGARFECTLTGWKYCKLYTGNLLLLIFTLGLAWPWVSTRTAGLRLDNLFIEGVLDFSSIEQDARAATATGEGFADFLGMDFGV